MSRLPSALETSARANDDLPTASYDPDADWCTDDLNFAPGDKRFVPDGVIVQIGEVFFRICRSPVATSTWDRRAMRFFHNPQRVPGLIFERSMMGLMVSVFVAGHFGNWENFISDWLKDRMEVGKREIGGLTYTVFKYFDHLTQSTVQNEQFFFAGSTAGDHVGVPMHILDCNDDLGQKTEGFDSCTIRNGYGSVQANLLVIGGGGLKPDLTVENLPAMAQDVCRILSAADVSDRLDELNDLPVIRQADSAFVGAANLEIAGLFGRRLH